MRNDVQKAGADLRSARLRSGLTLRDVATATGASASTVLRTEQGRAPGRRPVQLAMHAEAVGLRARLMLFLADDPLHDAPQIRLLRDFREAIGPQVRMDVERPVVSVPGTSDRRAFDAVLHLGSVEAAAECYTRFHDCGGQLRSALLKQRDAQIPRLLIVVRATRANRAAVASAADIVAMSFPLGTRTALSALRAGRDPGANGLIFI